MTKSFNKEDILTTLTTDKAKIGDRGYFGDTLKDIKASVECGEVYSLVWIDNENLSVYPFKGNFFEDRFALFLPANKVNQPAKKKEKVYREIRNIDDLFNLLQPFVLLNVNESPSDVTEKQKIDALLGKHIEIKHAIQNHSCHVIIQSIGYNEVLRKMTVNNIDTVTLGNYYEIKLEGKWRPFAVEYEAEEQDSDSLIKDLKNKRSKDKDADNSLSD